MPIRAERKHTLHNKARENAIKDIPRSEKLARVKIERKDLKGAHQ